MLHCCLCCPAEARGCTLKLARPRSALRRALLHAAGPCRVPPIPPHPPHIRSSQPPTCSYPEGLLLAIHHLSAVSVPIYITETGVADRGDALRAEMIDGYMAQVGGAGLVGPGPPAWLVRSAGRLLGGGVREGAAARRCARSTDAGKPLPHPLPACDWPRRWVERAAGLGPACPGLGVEPRCCTPSPSPHAAVGSRRWSARWGWGTTCAA